MTFLLDTNVVSEPARARPSAAVLGWLAETDPARVYLSVLTLGELRKGAEKLRATHPHRAASIDEWLATITADFASRVLDVDDVVADRWGRFAADLTANPVDCIDGLIAATALVHGLTVVTRNVRHFAPTGVPTLDPFEGG